MVSGTHRDVWYVLRNVLGQNEAKFELLPTHPLPVHALAGRQIDQNDSKRIGEVSHDALLKANFIVAPVIRELRDVGRRRTHRRVERNRGQPL